MDPHMLKATTRTQSEQVAKDLKHQERVAALDKMDWEFDEITDEFPIGKDQYVFDPAACIEAIKHEHADWVDRGAAVINLGAPLVTRKELADFKRTSIHSANVFTFTEDPITGIYTTKPHLKEHFPAGKPLKAVIPESTPYEDQEWSKGLVVNLLLTLLKSPSRLYKLDMKEPLWRGPTCRFLLNLVLDPLCFFALLEGDVPGVSSTWTYVSQALTAACIHCEDNNVASLNLLVSGSPKFWMIFDLANTQRLRTKIAKYYGGPGRCIGVMNTKEFLIPPWLLKKWKIDFKVIIQRPGMMVLTFEGCSHQVLNLGYSINDSVNFMSVGGTKVVLKTEDYQCQCHTKLTGEAKAVFRAAKKNSVSYLIHGQDVLTRFHFNWLTTLPAFLRQRDPLLAEFSDGIISVSDRRRETLPTKLDYLCDYYSYSDQLQLENQRLRKERDQYKTLYEKLHASITPVVSINSTPVEPVVPLEDEIFMVDAVPAVDEFPLPMRIPYSSASAPNVLEVDPIYQGVNPLLVNDSFPISVSRPCSTSTAVGSHICSDCGKSYKHDSSLAHHRKTHTAGPFKCPLCPITFIHSTNLYRHRRNMHPLMKDPNTLEKP